MAFRSPDRCHGRLTVAHIDHTGEPGGAEFALSRLIGNEPKWDALLFTPPVKSDLSPYASLPTNRRIEVGVQQPTGAIAKPARMQISLFFRLLVQSLAVRANPRFRKATIVHSNTTRAAIIGLLASLGSKKKFIMHLRDTLDPGLLGSRNVKILTLLLPRASAIVANSDFTLQSALAYIKEETPVCVVPSPVGLETERPVRAAAKEVRRVGMVARITEWKGHELVIKAFGDVFRGSTAVLEFAGSPAFGEEGYLSHLRDLARQEGLEKQVRFLGHVEDIWALLGDWDICVQASLQSEPLGQNVLQYLAACRPVVASASGGPCEWIRHEENGILFETGSRRDLAACLRRLSVDQDLRNKFVNNLAMERPVPTDTEIRESFLEFLVSLSH